MWRSSVASLATLFAWPIAGTGADAAATDSTFRSTLNAEAYATSSEYRMNTSSISTPSGESASTAAAWSKTGTRSRAVCRAMVESTKDRNAGARGAEDGGGHVALAGPRRGFGDDVEHLGEVTELVCCTAAGSHTEHEGAPALAERVGGGGVEEAAEQID
nr:unnamed protein product [Digitaria exilis]